MSGIFHGVAPTYVAFVYDPADGATLITEKISTLLSPSSVPVPTDVAIDENDVLTFSGPDYENGQFTANPGDVISFNFGAPFLTSAPVDSVLNTFYALVGPYDPSLPGV